MSNIVCRKVVLNLQLIKKTTELKHVYNCAFYLFIFIAASTRGTNTDGAVPKDTLIIFAIGG